MTGIKSRTAPGVGVSMAPAPPVRDLVVLQIRADLEGRRPTPRRSLGAGYSHPAVKIFMPSGASEPVYVPYTQHYPPDTKAALRWLMNRQPDKWRDRQDVNVTGSIANRLGQMTPEERGRYAHEFVERERARRRGLRRKLDSLRGSYLLTRHAAN